MALIKPQSDRLLFIDNLRILLCILVIAHHAGQAYGPGGWWYFTEPKDDRARVLGLFFVINRSFFMSLFFMVSGYFMPASFDRKGAARFVKDRLWRLGMPLLVFFFGIIPYMLWVYYHHFRPYGPIPFGEYYRDVYFGMAPQPPGWTGPSWPDLQFGHLWFVEHLLIAALVYAAWRWWRNGPILRHDPQAPPPTHRLILVVSAAVALTTFVVRLVFPIDYWMGFLVIIQVMFADVPRDLTWFCIGVIAYRRNWLARLPDHIGRTWLRVGIGAAVFCLITAPLGVFPFAGGGVNIGAILGPIWESLLCSGMCIGLAYLFRKRLNHAGPLAKELAACTYAVYLFHVPVIVPLQYALGLVDLPCIVKFLIVTVAGVPLTFLVSMILRRMPGVRTVL